MSVFYPLQTYGRSSVCYGLTPSLLHARYGVDFGERFHRDIAFRVEALMEADRAVARDFRELGIGFAEPFPRATIEPFGHRFVPALYGCEIAYSPSEDPMCRKMSLDPSALESLAPWSRHRLEATVDARIVLEQARWAREHCDREEAERRLGYNPHSLPLSSLQNLGSVVNTAVSVFGEDALLLGIDAPDVLRAFYANVTDLMLVCLDYFPVVDGRRLHTVFVGDCSVSMISPSQYAELNLESDRRLAMYARSIGARFLVHQDSGATPHLCNYALLGKVDGLDFGQDTNWELASRTFVGATANCIIFPSWLHSHTKKEIEEELRRLMRAGNGFTSFTFSILEVDPRLAAGKIFEFHDAFRAAAVKAGG